MRSKIFCANSFVKVLEETPAEIGKQRAPHTTMADLRPAAPKA